MSDEQKGPGIDEQDAAAMTGSSVKETTGAWHAARDDADASQDVDFARGSGSGEQKSDYTKAESLSGLQEAMANTDPDAADEQ